MPCCHCRCCCLRYVPLARCQRYMRTCCRFPRPLGLFPTTVDNRLVRVVAILRFFVILLAAVLAIVFSVHKTGYLAAGWICVGLFVEFILGTFGGSSACPLGALSAVRLVCSCSRPSDSSVGP